MEGHDELIGAPLSTAARVIGVAERRLRRWAQVGLVLPGTVSTIGSRSIPTYSLEDLVQGRIVCQLEDRGVDIRVIRRIVEAVRSSIVPRPLSMLRWATSGAEVFVGYPDGSWVGDRRPDQTVIPEVLDLDMIRSSARDALRRPSADAGHTVRRRGVMGGKELFVGTRIPVATIVQYLESGRSVEQIIASFPDLRTEDVEVARRGALLTA